MAIYALLDNTDTTVLQYPLTIYNIRAMFPNISWPESPTTEQLLPYHLVIVIEVVPPQPTKKTVVTEGTPEKQPDGTWLQIYIISPKTSSLTSTRDDKRAKLAAFRYEKECGGILVGEYLVNTDRESQSKLNAIYVMIKNGLWTSGKWKLKTGKFASLTAEQMEHLCLSVAQHVKTCFDTESDLVDALDATEDLDVIDDLTWPE